MYCAKCGTKFCEGDIFCADCGTQAADQTPTPNATTNSGIPDEPHVSQHKPTDNPQHQANGNTPARRTDYKENTEKTEPAEKKKSSDPVKVILKILLAICLIYIAVLRFGPALRGTNTIPDGVWATENFDALWYVVGDTYGVYYWNHDYGKETFSAGPFARPVENTNMYNFYGRGRYSISGDIITLQINDETLIFLIAERGGNYFVLEETRFNLLIYSSVSELVDRISEFDSE